MGYASEIIYSNTVDLFLVFWVIGGLIALVSCFLSIFLMHEHFVLGKTKEGLTTCETNYTLKILAIHPLFTITAYISLYYPDLGYIFQLLQTTYVSLVVYWTLGYAIWALGGARKFLEHVSSIAPTQIWQHVPGCCIWGWCKCACKSSTGFCGNDEVTPEYDDVMKKIMFMVGQFMLVPPCVQLLLVSLDGYSSASSFNLLYTFSSMVWVSMLCGWFGFNTVMSWMGAVDVAFDKDMDAADLLMIHDVDETSNSAQPTGAGPGVSADDVDVKPDPDPDLRQSNDQLRGSNVSDQDRDIKEHGSDSCGSKCTNCCFSCTTNTQLAWDILLEKVFRETPDTFGEQFCVRRKCAFVCMYFFQILTLTGFLGTFMPKLIVSNGVWLNEIQMSQAWTGFLIICFSLPLSLLAWFAFPVAGTPENREPMKELAQRVIRGPNPRAYPPEASSVGRLIHLVASLHDSALLEGIDVEKDPSIIKNRINRRNDML